MPRTCGFPKGGFYSRLTLPAYPEWMGIAEQQHQVDEAFEKIEGSILPNMSMMLDMLLDTATLNRPGKDAEVYAAELRTLALQLETLTRQVEAISPVRIGDRDYRLFSVA